MSDDFGERLKIARIAKGLNQRELAEKIGLTKQQITKYETGSSTPSYDVLKKICLELNTSANWLMGITLRNDI